MGAVEKIFDNFETLCDDYTDTPQAWRARKAIYSYLEEKGINILEAECYITSLMSEYERQGFLYGFRYATALFMDGTLQYEREQDRDFMENNDRE